MPYVFSRILFKEKQNPVKFSSPAPEKISKGYVWLHACTEKFYNKSLFEFFLYRVFFDTAYLFASSILLKYSAQANCKDAI